MPETQTFGLFTVDHTARKVRGILVPWDEMSRVSQTGNKPMRFKPGDVRLPRDVSVVGLNRRHNRFDPLGRLAKAEPVAAGLFAEFDVADTEEGDDWLADHGALVRLSPELRDIRVAPDGYGTATLTGAALVEEGAFASAGLFAVGEVVEAETTGSPVPTLTQGTGNQSDDEPDEGDEDDDPAPAEADQEPSEDSDDNQEEEAMPEATAPTALMGARTPKAEVPALTANGFFAAMHTARKTGDWQAMKPYLDEAEAGLFALNDVKYDGSGGLVTAAGIPQAWLGELWQGRRFARTIVPLLTQATLTSLTATAWIWNAKPTMAAWGGNKANVPSNAPTVTPKNYDSQRFAGGHDLAREYFDFNVTEVIESYVAAMVDSYAVLSDEYALTQLVADATAFTPGAAGDTDPGLAAIVDGALAVIAARATPSFAIVAPDVYRGVLFTPHSDAMEYFDLALGLEEGASLGFRIVPDARLAAGQVLVGAKEAATVWELPGSPIRVSAPDLVKGGIDQAFFGYVSAAVTYPAAVVKANITPTP